MQRSRDDRGDVPEVLELDYPPERQQILVVSHASTDGTAGPRLVAIPAYRLSSNIAALLASIGVLRGQRHATWERTRRAAAVPRQGDSA